MANELSDERLRGIATMPRDPFSLTMMGTDARGLALDLLATRQRLREREAEVTDLWAKARELRARLRGYEGILCRVETRSLAVRGADEPIQQPKKLSELLDYMRELREALGALLEASRGRAIDLLPKRYVERARRLVGEGE